MVESEAGLSVFFFSVILSGLEPQSCREKERQGFGLDGHLWREK
jgi:hypothetical protein